MMRGATEKRTKQQGDEPVEKLRELSQHERKTEQKRHSAREDETQQQHESTLKGNRVAGRKETSQDERLFSEVQLASDFSPRLSGCGWMGGAVGVVVLALSPLSRASFRVVRNFGQFFVCSFLNLIS
jgi:hypothetical protein